MGLLVKAALFAQENEESVTPDDSGSLELTDNDWEEIYCELEAHAIAGIPFEWAMEHLKIPEAVRSRWEQSRMNQVVVFSRLLQEQSELCRLMQDAGIPMVILKGTAAAMYYPDPYARAMGDIDFLVGKSDFQRAYQLMKDNGYQLMYEENHSKNHITLHKNGFMFEIHHQPVGVLDDCKEGEYLLELIWNGIENAEIAVVDFCRVPMLPWLQNGIVLLTHIVRHLKTGIGLRHIIDWMMYVNSKLHDDNWYGSMRPVLEKAGLETMTKSVTRMCQLYLGLSENEITWCSDADESVCGDLMSYIIMQGNFGRKVLMQDKGARIVGEVHNPIQFFKLLQEKGLARWDLAQKHPVFKCVAWLYTICRYIKKSLQRKAPVKTLVADVKAGKDRRKLFDELELYQK